MDYVDPKIETISAASPPSPLFQQSFNLTGLERATEYRARVVGFNVRGEGLVSAYVVAETCKLKGRGIIGEEAQHKYNLAQLLLKCIVY